MSESEVADLLLSLARCRGRVGLETFQRWMPPSRTGRAETAAGIQRAVASRRVTLSVDGKYLLAVGTEPPTAADRTRVLDWLGRLQSTMYADLTDLGAYPVWLESMNVADD